MDDVKLLPCPFCGSDAEIERGSDHHGSWFNLGCSRHWGRVPDPDKACLGGRLFYTETEKSEAEAVAAWNRRWTGITYQTEQRCACQPALTPALEAENARSEAKLKEALAEGLREAIAEGMRIATVVPVEQVPTAINVFLARAAELEKPDGQA